LYAIYSFSINNFVMRPKGLTVSGRVRLLPSRGDAYGVCQAKKRLGESLALPAKKMASQLLRHEHTAMLAGQFQQCPAIF
jgi:hypothetical protein